MKTTKRDEERCFFLLTATLIVALLVVLPHVVWGQDLAAGIQILQPRLKAEDARTWAQAIRIADEEAEIGNPWLLAAMVRRESSFFDTVFKGTKRGRKRNEIGALQLHSVALRVGTERAKCGKTPSPGCLLRAGAHWLAYSRETCKGSTWRWMAAYGLSYCPSERQARRYKHTRRAKMFYDNMRPGKVVEW